MNATTLQLRGGRIRREDYHVGWVCALSVELAAAQEMLEEEHQDFVDDNNIYTLGRIGEHNVVIACLPEGQTGITSAAVVAIRMQSTFTSIRFGLLVGIGGGVPSKGEDIRLGDVVIGVPHKLHSGVVQYDFGKATPSGFERTGALNSPPTVLLNAVAKVRANHFRGRSKLLEFASKLNSLPTFARENAGHDTLFKADYNHVGGDTCDQCDGMKVVERRSRSTQEIMVHYGTIASGNQVMRNAAERDRFSSELGGVLCFEMEAAGLINSFPCLVIRGICDYADSHKNKTWQAYAAGTSAACAKEVLSMIPTAEVANSRTAHDITREPHPSSNPAIVESPSVDDIPAEQHRQYSSSATLKGHFGSVNSVAFSPDGKLLASASEDGMIKLRNAAVGAAGSVLRTLNAGLFWAAFSVAFSPDSKLLASGWGNGVIKLWDAEAWGAPLQTLKGDFTRVKSVAFSPDGKLLASGSLDGKVRLWDAAAGLMLQTLEGHSDSVESVAFSPDGKLLASGSKDWTAKLWDVEAGGLALQTLKGHSGAAKSVAFSPDGKLLALGSKDGTIRLWDATAVLEADSALRTLEGHSGSVRSVSFSPDSKLLASGSEDKTIKLWDAEAGVSALQTLTGHSNWVNSVVFSPDGKLLASGSKDGRVRLWATTRD